MKWIFIKKIVELSLAFFLCPNSHLACLVLTCRDPSFSKRDSFSHHLRPAIHKETPTACLSSLTQAWVGILMLSHTDIPVPSQLSISLSMKWTHQSLMCSLQPLFSTLPGTHTSRLLGMVDMHRSFFYLSTGTEARTPPVSALPSLCPRVPSPRHSQSHSHIPRTEWLPPSAFPVPTPTLLVTYSAGRNRFI